MIGLEVAQLVEEIKTKNSFPYLLSADNWCISYQREVNPWVGHKVGLELSQIHIECSIKPERCRYGRYNLADETVQVGVGRPLNIQVSAADIIDSFIVHHESTV